MESESQAGDDAFSFAQAEQRFLALHRSNVRNHKMLRLGELRQRFTDPIETKAFKWVEAWIAHDSPVCQDSFRESFALMGAQYRHCLITAIIEVSTWCENDTLIAIANLGPMLGRDLRCNNVMAFAAEYQQTTTYPSPVLAKLIASHACTSESSGCC